MDRTKFDSLKPGDEVTVTVWGPKGEELYKSTGPGYHSLASAISATIDNASLKVDPEDCVFEVTNQKTDVTHRYRINAHGHLKLIV